MKNEKSNKMFYEGEAMTYPKAGSVLIKRMVEIDFVRRDNIPKNVDTYAIVAPHIGKKAGTIRAWTYDWSTNSGASPTIIDFLNLIHVIGGERVSDFIKCLDPEFEPTEESKKFGNIIRTISDHIRDLADELTNMSEDYLKNGKS